MKKKKNVLVVGYYDMDSSSRVLETHCHNLLSVAQDNIENTGVVALSSSDGMVLVQRYGYQRRKIDY